MLSMANPKQPRRSLKRQRRDTPRSYLDDPTFSEAHAGPKIPDCRGGYSHLERDPSPAQIRRMCEAIRATWSEAERIIRQRCPHLDDVAELTAEPTPGVRVHSAQTMARIA